MNHQLFARTAGCLATLLLVPAAFAADVTTPGGTANNVAKFSGAAKIVNSAIFENGGKVGIGTNSPTSTLTVNGGLSVASPAYVGNFLRIFTGVPDLVTSFTDLRSNPANGNSALDAQGAGNLTFNYSHGTGGVNFGNGASVVVGGVSNTGNASFNGTGSFLGSGSSFFTGKLGVGTSAPASPLTVNGVIQSLAGGIKFPDSTVQTTAAVSGLSSVSHDSTLSGNGTSGTPLGVAPGLSLYSSTASWTILGDNTNTSSGTGIGVYGYDGSGSSVASGIYGFTDSGFGVKGTADSTVGYGVAGYASGSSGIAVYANASGSATTAGYFLGDVTVTGNLSKSSGSFKIDHPVDPANKFLYHSFVESPDMMNIYNGNVTTDGGGYATITLPDWFGALNRDFRYQLTPIGQFAQAMVATEIDHNQFVIKTDKANVKVSWQVTGIRQDAWANAHRIPVEEEKPANEQGYYLHPELYNQPAAKNIEAVIHPGKGQPEATPVRHP